MSVCKLDLVCVTPCNNTVKVLINATLFNNYVFKSRVSLEVEKLSYRPGVALLEGRILIGGIFGTWCACGRALSFKGQVSAAV